MAFVISAASSDRPARVPVGTWRERAAGRVEPYYGPVASPGYLRFPHIADDIVVFVAADDLWLAPLAGGRAWRVHPRTRLRRRRRGWRRMARRWPGLAPRMAARRSTMRLCYAI